MSGDAESSDEREVLVGGDVESSDEGGVLVSGDVKSSDEGDATAETFNDSDTEVCDKNASEVDDAD